jgi:hypothetical protein
VLSSEKRVFLSVRKKKKKKSVFNPKKKEKKGRVLWRTRKEQLILFVFDSLGIS